MPSLKCNQERQSNRLKNPGVSFVQKPQFYFNSLIFLFLEGTDTDTTKVLVVGESLRLDCKIPTEKGDAPAGAKWLVIL